MRQLGDVAGGAVRPLKAAARSLGITVSAHAELTSLRHHHEAGTRPDPEV
ncbi:hypothetical protein E2C01_079619 [Portunus trituberculatus]|uniref:Uncharacterized protein n=1 Tax=Portunus trituberculatus TaxID=210409 RepID=A0A5B7IRV5_PORTR|nr:hypothetical protein [Portunus trituberculatus]